MAIEENKALVRRFYEEIWARGNVEFAQEVLAEDYLRHDLRPTAAAPGPQGPGRLAYLDSTRPGGSGLAASSSRAACQAGCPG